MTTDPEQVRVPFPDLDVVHWLDAYEPENTASLVVELDDQSAPPSGEEA